MLFLFISESSMISEAIYILYALLFLYRGTPLQLISPEYLFVQAAEFEKLRACIC
jgi:hypothetical protein